MKSVSGTTWGADRQTLSMMYTAWVRPVMEYPAAILTTACKTYLTYLDRVESSALRVILGTPMCANITTMYSEARIETLAHRRIKAATNLVITINRKPANDPLKVQFTKYADSYLAPHRILKMPTLAGDNFTWEGRKNARVRIMPVL